MHAWSEVFHKKLFLQRLVLAALFGSLLLFSAILYFRLSTDLPSSNDPLTGISKDVVEESLVRDLMTAEDAFVLSDLVVSSAEPCVPTAALWRLPAVHFQLIPWKYKLDASNHAMALVGQPFDKLLRRYVNHITNTTVCIKGEVTYEDVFEILRYRYVPNPLFNANMDIEELKRYAQLLGNTKGKEMNYTHDYGIETTEGSVFHYNIPYKDPCFLRKISLKYTPECSPDDKLVKIYQKQLLIVAVQRSGTHFVWEMMNRLGVDLHHEGVGPDGAVSWLYAINAQSRIFRNRTQTVSMQFGYAINNPQKLTLHRFQHVFHQVRHPLRVISTLVSRCDVWDKYWIWISRITTLNIINKNTSPLKRGMLLYLLWNRHMELYSDVRYRTEVTSARDVCRWAGFNETSQCSRPFLEAVNKTKTSPKQIMADFMAGKKGAMRHQFHRYGNHPKMQPAHMQRKLLEEEISEGDELKREFQERVESLKEEYALSHSLSEYKEMKNLRNSPPSASPIKQQPKKPFIRVNLTWADLDKEDLVLSNELRIMCLEYGFPLNPSDMPQKNDTFAFKA